MGGITVAIVAGLAIGMYTGMLPISAEQIANGAGYFLLLVMIGFFAWLFYGGDWTPAERKRLFAIGVLFLASMIFWSEFEQAGSTLNLFGDRATRTEIFGWQFPSSYYQSLQPLFIITFAPVFAWLWLRLGRDIEHEVRCRSALRRRRIRAACRRRRPVGQRRQGLTMVARRRLSPVHHGELSLNRSA